MSQPLFPVVEVPDFISEDSQYDTQYKRSMKWNTELGRLRERWGAPD